LIFSSKTFAYFFHISEKLVRAKFSSDVVATDNNHGSFGDFGAATMALTRTDLATRNDLFSLASETLHEASAGMELHGRVGTIGIASGDESSNH
jgi:hypothetical protein